MLIEGVESIGPGEPARVPAAPLSHMGADREGGLDQAPMVRPHQARQRHSYKFVRGTPDQSRWGEGALVQQLPPPSAH